MAFAKLALLSVGFKSGFLGGPTFPVIFASTSVALALNIAFPSLPVALLVAGIMTGAVYVLFRTPLMVVLLTRLHAGREHHSGGAHRAGPGHGHDRLPAAGAAHGGAAGAARCHARNVSDKAGHQRHNGEAAA